MATTNHPFITKLYHSFHSHERLFMVMEYCCGGELWTTIRKQPYKRLNEEQVSFYASEVLLVLEYIHFRGFIYRGHSSLQNFFCYFYYFLLFFLFFYCFYCFYFERDKFQFWDYLMFVFCNFFNLFLDCNRLETREYSAAGRRSYSNGRLWFVKTS